MTSSCAHERNNVGNFLIACVCHNLLFCIFYHLSESKRGPRPIKTSCVIDWLIDNLEHRFIMLSMSSVLKRYNFLILILYKHVWTSLNYILLILGSIWRYISFTIAEGGYHSETTDVFMRWIAIHRNNSACKCSLKVRAEWCGNGYVERVFHC